MTRMTGPDCVVMCNLINTHTHTHTHTSNLYTREPPKLLFALHGGLEVVESARGVQQGCNLGPLCYSAGSLKILKEFRANPPVPGARAVSFIHDITVILPPELSLDMAAIGKVTEWLQERLGVEGISLNRRKSQALLADGVGPEQLTEEQRVAMGTTGLTVVRQGMRIVGVPVGTEQFQRDSLQEAVNGEPAELVRALVPMEDAQASFQILRHLPLLACHICFEQSRPPSRTKLQQITTLWWSGRWRLS